MNQPIETYTFSRALHLMRYGGKKMRFITWSEDMYIQVIDEKILYENGVTATLTNIEIFGSWVEVK